jgi:hypothetical protein
MSNAIPDTGNESPLAEEEIARRRDETIKRMIKMPAQTQKGAPKRAPQSSSSKGKRGS